MHLKPALALLLLIKVNCLFAQQIDIAPYLGLNNNITNVVLKMQTTSVGDPVIYNTMGAGLEGADASFDCGFYSSVIFKNNFGLQSGARFSKSNYSFFLTEIRHNEFGNILIYNFKSSRLSMPLHLVYDHRIKEANDNNVPKFIRFFIGPVFSYDFDQEARLRESHGVSSDTGILLASYSEMVRRSKWLKGIEFGYNINPIYKDWLSVGLLFQYNLNPVAKVNFESKTSYESATATVEVNNTGSFSVIGSSLMLQIGVKPFILTKE